MEFRTLKYFLTVAREENITRAAALLHLTQPTLSRQLMQLEEELGVKLFRRSQHHIVLTEAGMLLRRRAQEIVELAEKTARELRPAEEITGRISIGSGDLRSMTYLAKLLAAFHRQHPRVQYEIYSGDSDGIKERIEQGLLDMGLLLEPVDTSRYQILRLPVRESWGVLVPEDSPLARREAVTPGDLADSPLILTTRELMRREMIRWFGPYADRIQTGCGSYPSLRRWSRARFWPGRRPRSFLPPLLPCCDLPRNTSAEYQTIRYRYWTRRSSGFRMEASLRGRLHFLP